MNITHKNPPTTIVFMGDSITEGQYVHHASRWTELIVRRLRSKIASKIDFDALHFFNRGISGETTRQGLERFPRDVQVLKPNVMTLQFGLNDCNCWDSDKGLPRVSEAAYRANLIEMISRARKFGAKYIILSTNHPTLRLRKLVSGETLEQRRLIYNDIVREVSSKMEVFLCDIDAGFNGIVGDQLAAMLLPEPDVLHLSEAGHKHYAELIFESVFECVMKSIEEQINE